MYYSSKIFENSDGSSSSDMSVVTINFWVYFTNFFAVIFVVIGLNWFGRKFLMVVFNTGQAIVMVLLGVFLLQEKTSLCFIATLTFLAFFEVSSGPIVWLYIGEIAQPKAGSLATVAN